MYRGYPEQALITNRSSLLLFGGSESERRAWAEEAAANFLDEGPLTVASTSAQLIEALHHTRGVVYVPDATGLSDEAQALAVHVLREREERPKIVFGMAGEPGLLSQQGRLRDDLHYSLAFAQVDLNESGVREAIRVRRARAPRPIALAPAANGARRAPQSATPPKKRKHTVTKDRGARGKKTADRKSPARRRR